VIGEIFAERFYIDAKLASGGFGTVYRATHLPTNTPVAIKILHARYASNRAVTTRFQREATALRDVRHPHVVGTHELGVDAAGCHFLVMELLTGETLAERFAARGALHWRSVLAIVRETCSALAEAHTRGIVHRDLKPANIFLSTTPVPDFVKLLDFGIAKGAHGSAIDDGRELTRVGEAVGTLEYMAPEQLAGGAIDPRSDLYTLGVVAYEMIAGRRPFADANGATALITALLTRRPPPISTVTRAALPRDLDGVLLRCLERDPKDRYGDVRELAAAIDRMLASRSNAATTQQLWMSSASATAWLGAPAPATPVPIPVPVPVFDESSSGHFALGSQPVVVHPRPLRPPAPPPPRRLARVALALAALGVGIGIAFAVL
jgi:eukaryotic-like serine/threonine-protein kinase